MGLVAQHGGCSIQYILSDQILSDNGNDRSCRSYIFLGTCKNKPYFVTSTGSDKKQEDWSATRSLPFVLGRVQNLVP